MVAAMLVQEAKGSPTAKARYCTVGNRIHTTLIIDFRNGCPISVKLVLWFETGLS
jgi:hypothetical protein